MIKIGNRTFYASPDDDTEAPFLEFIKSAKKSVHVADYSFNMQKLTDLLISQKKAGLDVQCVLDKSQSGGKTEVPEVQELKQEKVPLAIGTSDEHKIMHLKVAIVDGIKSVYGSWNFTETATKETNFFVLDTDPNVAAWFETIYVKARDWILTHETQ